MPTMIRLLRYGGAAAFVMAAVTARADELIRDLSWRHGPGRALCSRDPRAAADHRGASDTAPPAASCPTRCRCAASRGSPRWSATLSSSRSTTRSSSSIRARAFVVRILDRRADPHRMTVGGCSSREQACQKDSEGDAGDRHLRRTQPGEEERRLSVARGDRIQHQNAGEAGEHKRRCRDRKTSRRRRTTRPLPGRRARTS